MSQENVEIVRRYYEAARHGLEAYWMNPRSAVAAMNTDDLAPEQREVLSYMDPDVEWRNAFCATFRGNLDFANGVDQLLEAARSYWIRVQEVTDLGGDHVLAVVDAAMKGRDSDIEVYQTVFSTVTPE
jgi:hypothetical protein